MRKLTGRLWWLGFLGFAHHVADSLAWTRLFFLFFLTPLLTVIPRKWKRKRVRSEDRAPDLPLPGPALRGGAALMKLRVSVSSALMLLNRSGRSQLLRQVAGNEEASRRMGGKEPGPGTYEQRVRYTLPFRGEWLVVNGGVTRDTSHSWEILSQRFAYDFVVADVRGRRHREGGSRLEEYYAYGQPVLSPADGEVVAVEDAVRDAPQVGTGWLDWRTPRIGGNSVTIRHAADEFSYLAHLAPGSMAVRVGQRVRRGQPVGKCGHSGHSTEPHIHFQIQDHPDFFRAVGLPIRFSGVVVGGAAAPDPLYLRAGMRVCADEAILSNRIQ